MYKVFSFNKKTNPPDFFLFDLLEKHKVLSLSAKEHPATGEIFVEVSFDPATQQDCRVVYLPPDKTKDIIVSIDAISKTNKIEHLSLVHLTDTPRSLCFVLCKPIQQEVADAQKNLENNKENSKTNRKKTK